VQERGVVFQLGEVQERGGQLSLEGKTKGRAEGEAKGILSVLEVRGIPVTDSVRERITSCTDLDRMDTCWSVPARSSAPRTCSTKGEMPTSRSRDRRREDRKVPG
jgi:hypothetical protein